MATDTVDYQDAGVMQYAAGGFTGAGAAVDVTLGFKPRYIKVFNETDATTWEWFKTMAATKVIKTVTAGTLTADTGTAILDNDDGTFTLSATLAASGKVCSWIAFG